MSGSQYFGQGYFGQGYAGLIGIQFDATANSGYQAALSSYSFNITVGNNPNRIVVVSVGLLSVTNSVTALTIGGVAATKLRADVSASGTIRTEIWYLVNPATGVNAVAVTLNTASVSGASADSLFNVETGSPVDAQSGGTGTTGAGGGSASISTTTITAGSWIVDVVAAPTTFTVGANQVQRANIAGAVGNLGQSDKGAIVIPAVTTMAWNNIAALTSWTMSTMAVKGIILQPIAISQVAATLTATTGTQSVDAIFSLTIGPTAANLALTGGTQSVATVNIVSISQVGSILTLTGGLQGIQDVRDVLVTQVGATLTITGGAQSFTAFNNVSLLQLAAILTVTGGIQVAHNTLLKVLDLILVAPTPLSFNLLANQPTFMSMAVASLVPINMTIPSPLSFNFATPSNIVAGVSVPAPITFNLTVPAPIELTVIGN
jgi:hypothetical protein